MVEKLNDMLKHRYGKGLSIRQLAGVGQGLTNEVSFKGEDLYIPIFVKDIFLGYGLVHEARGLSADDTNHVTRLVRMILEPHLYSEHLERTLINTEIEKNEGLYSADNSEETSKGIFLFGSNAHFVQKISMEIHEITQNWSYLNFADVASQIKTLADLKSLSGSTLVVDIEKGLSSEYQALMADYIGSKDNGPLLLFVSSKSARHISVNENLRQSLVEMEFAVDRLPLDKKALNEVLEMLYFKS